MTQMVEEPKRANTLMFPAPESEQMGKSASFH